MTTASNTVPGAFDSRPIAPPTLSVTQPLYWSIRRELWENRSIYLAPLGVAGAFLFAFVISLVHLPAKIRATAAIGPMQQHMVIAEPYDFVALLIMGAGFLVAIFYSLDALHGERRDRSILFWKSLPVSDLTTVLAKVSIPTVVIPLLTFAITIATQWIMLMLSSIVLLANGLGGTTIWNDLPWFQMSLMLFYHLVAGHGLWYAPIYGWLLLVSAWAKRATFLWAAFPLLAIVVIEKIVFSTSHFAGLLQYRFSGGPDSDALQSMNRTMTSLPHFHLGMFLTSTGLWIGLAFTALCLAGAVRLRRSQGPI